MIFFESGGRLDGLPPQDMIFSGDMIDDVTD
jgi:hypothetical protein